MSVLVLVGVIVVVSVAGAPLWRRRIAADHRRAELQKKFLASPELREVIAGLRAAAAAGLSAAESLSRLTAAVRSLSAAASRKAGS